MKALLHTTIEKALNAYLLSDEHSLKRLKKLTGRSIAVEMTPLNLMLICHFHEDRVVISNDNEHIPTTRIQGTPLNLFGVAISKEKRHQFFADEVTMEGDAEFAQQVVDLFDHIEIDWEEQTARLIGDIPAVKLGKLMRGIKHFFNQSETSFNDDVRDYLHEEAAWFPEREELKEFFDDIDTLRMDTDRLTARLAHLRSLIDKEEAE